MEKNIENLIEELTKVRPEMLNEEALKLFNTIMAVLDERDKLISKIKEKIEELRKEEERVYNLGYEVERVKYIDMVIGKIALLQELMEEK